MARIGQRCHQPFELQRLADRPDLDPGSGALAPAIEFVDQEMRRLDLAEGFEFEGQARMAGAPHAMGHEARLVAGVAGQAEHRPFARPVGRIEPIGSDQRVMRHLAAGMGPEPALGGTMASFAADAVAQLELHPALLGRHIVGVAVEADFGRLGIGQAEIMGDPLAELAFERLEGLGVLVVALPGQILVLLDIGRLAALGGTMAWAAGAAGDPQMQRIGRCGVSATGAVAGGQPARPTRRRTRRRVTAWHPGGASPPAARRYLPAASRSAESSTMSPGADRHAGRRRGRDTTAHPPGLGRAC